MRSLKLALLATAAVAALSSAAAAADLIVDVPIEEPVIDNSFSFDGAYIGAFLQGQTPPAAFGIGVNLGVNKLMDNLLIGAEISGAVLTGPNFDGQVTVKAGGLVADNAILYVYSGAGSKTFTSWYVPIGIGAEVAVADNVGIKAEVQYNWDLTSPAQNSAAAKVGLNFHF
jgi:opacity protein-like surface antigen